MIRKASQGVGVKLRMAERGRLAQNLVRASQLELLAFELFLAPDARGT
jgi:hypothetical protein